MEVNIGSVGGYENVIDNVDSLKTIIHIHSDPGIYEFQVNATYTYTNPTINPKKALFKEDVYTFEEKNCKIILCLCWCSSPSKLRFTIPARMCGY